MDLITGKKNYLLALFLSLALSALALYYCSAN